VAVQPASRATAPEWRKHRETIQDLALAGFAFAATLAMLAARNGASGDTRDLDLLGVLLAALASLPLVAWRRAPLAVFVVTATASVALNALDFPPGPPFGPTIAVFLLALDPDRARAPKWALGATVVGLLLVHAGAVGIAEDALPTVPLLFGALVWGGAWVLGDRVRERRLRVAELEERAHRAEREAERERRLAAAEERTRIARDLHDSVGHAINVILVQAGAARLLSRKDPERSRSALETIEDVARETLGEIDQLVGMLRDEDGAGDPARYVEPPLGLAAVGTMVERHRLAGVDVSVAEHGSPRPLPPALDQASYRILQEALTNAARHGGGSADVVIDFGGDSLELVVRNPTQPGSATEGPGHGIVGMRERAALLGGSLEAETRDGRFVVRARLPYAGEEP
jgi:signal transduction histidine kinase